jgi:hypothetical protein
MLIGIKCWEKKKKKKKKHANKKEKKKKKGLIRPSSNGQVFCKYIKRNDVSPTPIKLQQLF